LKDLELERLRLLMEQAAQRERKLLDERTLLDQKVELLRNECRDVERKAMEEGMNDRADLYALRKRVEYYESMETSLDEAIAKVAEGDMGGSDDPTLALGAVMAATPTASSRRLHESLTLARSLYKRQRELAAAEERISKLQSQLDTAQTEAAAADAARSIQSQPQSYLVDTIREKEKEAQFLKRRCESLEAELAAVRKNLLREARDKEEVQKDLQGVLSRRERLSMLQNLVIQVDDRPVQPAQPKQRGGRAGSAGPTWYEKLRAKTALQGPH